MFANRIPLHRLLAGLCVLGIAAAATSADAAAYIKFDGVDGEATAAGHEKWIELHSYSWGTRPQPEGQTTRPQPPAAGDFVVVKRLDKSSPKLMEACATGTHISSGTLVITTPGPNPRPLLKVTFSDMLISSYQTGGSTDSTAPLPTESISLNFTKITYEYSYYNPSGGLAETVRAEWDLTTTTRNSTGPEVLRLP